MSWLDAIVRFFRPAPSGAVAKERLRLVLLSDRINLAPEIVDELRADLIATISRYMEIDEVGLDVTFETRENDVALLANIPIKAVRARPLPPPAPPLAAARADEATGVVDLAEATEPATPPLDGEAEREAHEVETLIVAAAEAPAAPHAVKRHVTGRRRRGKNA